MTYYQNINTYEMQDPIATNNYHDETHSQNPQSLDEYHKAQPPDLEPMSIIPSVMETDTNKACFDHAVKENEETQERDKESIGHMEEEEQASPCKTAH